MSSLNFVIKEMIKKNKFIFLFGILILPAINPLIEFFREIVRGNIIDFSSQKQFDFVYYFLAINLVIVFYSSFSAFAIKVMKNNFYVNLEANHKTALINSIISNNKIKEISLHSIYQQLDKISDYISSFVLLLFNFIAFIVTLGYAFLSIHWIFGLSLIISMFILFLTISYMKKIQEKGKELLKLENESNTMIRQSAQFIEVVKANKMGDKLKKVFERKINNLKDKKIEQVKLSIKIDRINVIFQLYMSITFPFLMAILSYNHLISVGIVFIASGLLGNLMNLSTGLISSSQTISYVRPILKELNHVLYKPLDKTARTIEENIIDFRLVSIKNLYFSYDSSPVLKNITVEFLPESYNVIVGRSGCGKSTLLSIISGLLMPQKGEIYFDSIELSNDERLKNTSFVAQKNFLLPVSILENLQYGSDENLSDDIIESRFSELLNWVHSLPNQYHTILNEDGNNLSGGQRQSIGLCRALIKNTNVLLIDEGTSAQDEGNKKRIIDFLKQQNKTIIEVTHDMETIKQADQVCYIDNGEIIGVGKHDELLAQCPQYKIFIGEI